MRILMTISYDGSKFHGFQRQKNARNVQSEIELALTNILDEDINIKGAGRTDAFVHAYNQVIHFDTKKDIKHLKKKLNQSLKDIKAKKIKKVSSDFHARHSVKNKIYLYKIDLSGKKDERYFLRYTKNLDIKEMKRASKIFLGTHDFHNFVGGKRYNYTTTIEKISIYKKGSILYLKFKGLAFYRYMVRNLVGALLEVGKKKITKEVLEEMLTYPKREKRLPTSKANGLYLLKINY